MSHSPAANGHGLPPVAVLVVDDQAAVRDGVSRLIACAPIPLREVCTAATSAHALHLAAWLRPCLVLQDVDLGGEAGLALIVTHSTKGMLGRLELHADAPTHGQAGGGAARLTPEHHVRRGSKLPVHAAGLSLVSARRGGEDFWMSYAEPEST